MEDGNDMSAETRFKVDNCEDLVASITGGTGMPFGYPFDVRTANGTKLEVKFSKLLRHGKSKNPR
jgi:hypothetical protein